MHTHMQHILKRSVVCFLFGYLVNTYPMRITHIYLYDSLIVRLFCFVLFCILQKPVPTMVVLLFVVLSSFFGARLTHTHTFHRWLGATNFFYIRIVSIHYEYFVKVYSHITWLLWFGSVLFIFTSIRNLFAMNSLGVCLDLKLWNRRTGKHV